jgi:hypothetical protein
VGSVKAVQLDVQSDSQQQTLTLHPSRHNVQSHTRTLSPSQLNLQTPGLAQTLILGPSQLPVNMSSNEVSGELFSFPGEMWETYCL